MVKNFDISKDKYEKLEMEIIKKTLQNQTSHF